MGVRTMDEEPNYVEEGQQGDDYAEERARDEYEADMDAKAKYESDMSAQAEQEAQQQADLDFDEWQKKANAEERNEWDIEKKLKAIAETLQGQIKELRQRIEALEFDMRERR